MVIFIRKGFELKRHIDNISKLIKIKNEIN
ncbi:MAG: hypothetical protein ACI8YC_000005 [Salibacteraceae bacterium]|jgi:hypothetical protein